MTVRGVIFDLDGVIVSTDEFHYLGWKKLAEDEGIPFSREVNHRQRGVSRMESLDVLLEAADRTYSDEQKQEMATRKNDYYRQFLRQLSPSDILPGVTDLLGGLRERGVLLAVGSSSRNTPTILTQIGLDEYFDAVADGNDISASKPDPEVFLLAAERLGLPPAECLVVEDAEAGVEAGVNGGMPVLAVGHAASDPRATLGMADLAGLTAEDLVSKLG